MERDRDVLFDEIWCSASNLREIECGVLRAIELSKLFRQYQSGNDVFNMLEIVQSQIEEAYSTLETLMNFNDSLEEEIKLGITEDENQ